MLFVHEVHRVAGRHEDAFDAAFRGGWMPALAGSDDGRLLWYARHAHGTGPSYEVVTVTGVRDGTAWERLAGRVESGDLAAWARHVDELRHDVVGKVLVPVSWSPLQEVDLHAVPTDGTEHETTLFMEDTGWPHAPLDDYLRCWDVDYARPMAAAPPERRLLEVEACFQVAHGTGLRPEAVLWQRIVNHGALLHLLTHETAPEHKAPGTYMHTALGYRDQWRSRLLRMVPWSPLW